jgi:hypothetical protein
VALDSDRRASLLSAKLGALVNRHWPDDGPSGATGPEIEAGSFAGGATRRRGSVGWVLMDQQPERALGPALAWARQRQVDELHVLVDDHAGILARRAEAFVVPPSVWLITEVDVEPAHPVEVADPVVPPPAAMAAAGNMRDHGLVVVIDHGEVVGEVLGLEVARVIVDEDGEAHVEVGVGRHDREAFAMMNAGVAPGDALESVIATVSQYRRPDAEPHPLNRLAAPRWLRSVLVADPARVGVAELYPVEGILPRVTVKDSSPAAAVGIDEAGEPVVVVTSTGIDLDLVPTAADLRTTYAPDARLVLVVPERDAHPVTHALAGALDHPAEVIGLPGDWRK